MSRSLDAVKAALPQAVRQRAESRAAELRTEFEGLQALRQAREQTQVALAERMRISQASVAKLEQRTDMLLSTLRHYVEGLGGELTLSVSFAGRPPVHLSGIGDIPSRPKSNAP